MPSFIGDSLKLAAELRTDIADIGFIKEVSAMGEDWGELGHPPVKISDIGLAPEVRERLAAILRIFNIGMEAGKERAKRRCRK